MRSRRWIPLFIIAVTIAGLASRRVDAAPPSPAPTAAPAAGGTRVAIANVSYIFSHMQEKNAMLEKLKLKQRDLEGQAKAKRDAIEQMIQDREVTYNPKHPKYLEVCRQIDKAQGEFQAWEAVTKADAEREQKLMVKGLYDKIEAAVALVAEKQGIDLVIADGRQEITNLEAINAENLNRVLTTRTVLYATKAVNITEFVQAVLDQQFAANGGAVAPPTPPAPPLVPH